MKLLYERSDLNSLGCFWMVLSMFCFSIEDALIKTVAESLPIGQTLILFGLGGMSLFAGFSCYKGENLFKNDALSSTMRLRLFFEVAGRLFYMLALALTSLSSATVILQATPIVVVLGSWLFFNEKIGLRQWLAILIGLLGVIVIVQPGTDSFSVLSVLALLGMLGFAGRDLASRAAPSTLSIAILGFYGFLALVLAGAVYSLWQGAAFLVPGSLTVIYLIIAVLAGVIAYSGLMIAMRTGEISSVAPFRYTRLIFGVSLGVIFFGEQLDSSTVLGCGLIVFSGVIIMLKRKSVEKTLPSVP